MKPGIFSRAITAPNLEEKFRRIAGLGLKSVQFKMSCAGLPALPDKIEPETAARVATAARAHGIEIAALSGTYNMIHPDRAERKLGLARLEVLAAAAGSLGTHCLTLCTGTRDRTDMWRPHRENGSAEAWQDLIESLAAALEMAERRGVVLAVEPEPVNVIADAAKCRALLDTFPTRRLGVIFDAANLIQGQSPAADREILARALGLLGDRIVLAHAKDRGPGGEPVPLGQGQVDFPWFLRALAATGFTGTIALQTQTEAEVPQAAAYLLNRVAST